MTELNTQLVKKEYDGCLANEDSHVLNFNGHKMLILTVATIETKAWKRKNKNGD